MKESVSATRPYHHGDLRRALLDTAAGLLERSGPAALTLREIARTAGVSHAAAYRHFTDKEALLAYLGGECVARAKAMSQGALKGSPGWCRWRCRADYPRHRRR